MHALFTAIILWVEATLAAIFFFATLVGSLEESLFSLLSIIAALGVLSLVAAWKLPPALTYKIGVQTALVEGCVLFAFAFVWLLSTSMKYDEEIFVYPPRWIPANRRRHSGRQIDIEAIRPARARPGRRALLA